jgi:ATP-dependent helicase/nuclease subunit B
VTGCAAAQYAQLVDTLGSVSSSLDPEIAALLARGGRVVTANMRAARALRRAYAEEARLRGLKSWPAPRISDWTSWTTALYDALAIESEQPSPVPLSLLQEELLWRRVQREDAARVVSPARLARLALDAYALLGGYDAHTSRKAPWAAEASEDAERFLQWAEAFERECSRLHITSRSNLEAILRNHAQLLSTAPGIESEWLLVGFDRLTPSQSGLLAAFAATGTVWTHARPAPVAVEAQLICAPDDHCEIAACAHWVQQQLTQSPALRIGILTPQLSGKRAAIERGFRRILGTVEPPASETNSPLYEFSLGDPLAVVPTIEAALLLLGWPAGPLAGPEVSSLLVSGFLASDSSEAALLAQADVELRQHGRLRSEMSIQALLQDAARHPSLLPFSVRTRLQNAHTWTQREADARRTYTEWAERAPDLLAVFGWPGIVERGSVPFQAEQRWQSLIDETASLGFTGERIRWAAYVADLRSAASATLFAAESIDSPVQIIGLSEASGQTFDAIWVLGMTEDSWPLRGRPHPLLPPWLQREHAMPHASPQTDLTLAEQQLRRVHASAPRIIWSYSLQAGGIEQRPSPTLSQVTDGLQPIPAAEPPPVPPPVTVRVADSLLGSPWPVKRTAGGSDVLKYQAACGFQSFARGRLRAAPLEPEAWGLDAAERGKLLHRALERLWSTKPVVPESHRLHSQDDLLRAIDNDTLQEAVRMAVTSALSPLLQRSAGDRDDDLWMHSFVALETERLSTRLLFWLEQEAERAPFRVVALEQTLEAAHIGELRLRLRLDRADAVAGNRLLLIDYKTAQDVSVKQWQGDRLDEPQLPIYALYGDLARNLHSEPDAEAHEVGAVAFAQIRAGNGKTKLHGLAEAPEAQLGSRFRTPEGKPMRHLLSEEVRTAWHVSLQGLASAFLHGEAPVHPKDGATTCDRCGIFALCRVRSQRNRETLLADSSAEDGEGHA